MNLIKMTQFVDKQSKTEKTDSSEESWLWAHMNSLTKIEKYNAFLLQQIEFYHIIPCDKEGKPMNKPRNWGSWKYLKDREDTLLPRHTNAMSGQSYCYEYYEALQNVLFEGFEVKKSELFDELIYEINYKDITFCYDPNTKEFKTEYGDLMVLGSVEDLAELSHNICTSIKLTESVIKKLEL